MPKLITYNVKSVIQGQPTHPKHNPFIVNTIVTYNIKFIMLKFIKKLMKALDLLYRTRREGVGVWDALMLLYLCAFVTFVYVSLLTQHVL